MFLRKEFDACQKLIDAHQSFVLTTHVNPDADGLGSELALGSYLLGLGKQVRILNHSSTPPNCLFLDPGQRIVQFNPSRDLDIVEQADIVIVLDANQLDRIGDLKSPLLRSKTKKICFDHHLDKEDFADLFLIDEAAAATGEILFRFFKHVQYQPLSAEEATCLYTAIMTDTGSFRFPKTDGDLHRMVADLLDQGADPVSSYQEHYEQESPGGVRLLARAMESITLTHEGAVATMVVTRKDFRETGTSEPETHSFVTKALQIRGVRIGLLLTELEDGIKISFRSKGEIPINKLAQEFGGNGHKNAAGARVAGGTLETVLPALLQRAQQYIQT